MERGVSFRSPQACPLVVADVIVASHAGTGGVLAPVPLRTYAIDLTWRRPQRHPPNRVKVRGGHLMVEEGRDWRPRRPAPCDPGVPLRHQCEQCTTCGKEGCLATYHGARMRFVMLLRVMAAIRTTSRGVNEPQRLGSGGREPIGRPLGGSPCGTWIAGWPLWGPEPRHRGCREIHSRSFRVGCGRDGGGRHGAALGGRAGHPA